MVVVSVMAAKTMLITGNIADYGCSQSLSILNEKPLLAAVAACRTPVEKGSKPVGKAVYRRWAGALSVHGLCTVLSMGFPPVLPGALLGKISTTRRAWRIGQSQAFFV